jgi:hypothetical protein
MRTRLILLVVAETALLQGCAHAPPADFAPDPGLVVQIQAIRIIPGSGGGCPGATIRAKYEAVLADGSRVPFARSYDKKHPPRLHVVFLDRKSPDAVSREDGDWVTEPDPLATASTGFRLSATLRSEPSVTSTVVVPPNYACMPHTLAFWGAPGGLAGRAAGGAAARALAHTECDARCDRRDSNPHGLPHRILSPARLPVPPRSLAAETQLSCPAPAPEIPTPGGTHLATCRGVRHP